MEPIDPYLVARRVAAAQQLGASSADVRTDLYDHPLHGVVTPAYLSVDPVATRVSLAIALMGPANALGGWASLLVQGNTWFDGADRSGHDRDVLVHCLPGSQLRVRAGIEPSEGRVHADETVLMGSYAATTMARATYDEMRLAPDIREAVVALDMATSTTAETPHTSLEEVLHVVDAHHKTRGIVQARRALAMSTSRSASPWETRTRLLAELDVGLTGLLVNAPVFDLDGRLLGVVDLIDPVTGLVLETDGSHHLEDERRAVDHVRGDKLERAGAVVCRVTPTDHRSRWPTVGRIAAAQRDAVRATRRAWTLEQPDWWAHWPPARRWD